MACHPFKIGNATGFVCTGRQRRKRCGCGAWATLECDWKVSTRKSGTCDAPICATCTTSPAPDKDLCPEHAEAWRAWQAERQTA